MPEKIRKIYRSRTDRIVFGVCGGLGEYFEVDPVIFRLLFVFLAFIGSGILIYLISAIVVPLEPKKAAKASED